MAIAGASRYMNSAILANTQGRAAVGTDLVSSLGSIDMLDIARGSNRSGIGLSSQARFLNKQFLESTTSTFNAIFSLGVAQTASIDGLLAEINAKRGDTEVAERVTTGTEGSASFTNENGEKLSTREIAALKDTLRKGEIADREKQRAADSEQAARAILEALKNGDDIGSLFDAEV